MGEATAGEKPRAPEALAPAADKPSEDLVEPSEALVIQEPETPATPLDPTEERRVEVQRCLARVQRSQTIQDRKEIAAKASQNISLDACEGAQRSRLVGGGRRGGRRRGE